MASAQIAFLVISHPQRDDTDETLTSSGSTPAASANASCSWVRTSAGWSSTCTLMMSPLSDERSWIVASAPSIPLSSRIERASSTDRSDAGTSHATPPVKSRPRLSPLMLSDARLITIRTSDSPKPHHRRPQKSIAVWPRTRRPHLVVATRSASKGVSPVPTGSVSTVVISRLPSPNVSRRSSRPVLARRATAGRVKQKNTIRSHTVVMPR